jgi:ASC-1-like (ASCH) protein
VLVTLVYLAVQVRQSTATQAITANIAKADAANKIVERYSSFRQMLADESIAAVWNKAQSETELSPTEEIRLKAVLSELTYAGVAAAANYLIGLERWGADAGTPYAVVAREIGASNLMRRAWAELSDDLRQYHLGDFADEVTRRLETGGTGS